MTADEYAQEFECSFQASVRGAIYGADLDAARAAGRVCPVPCDPTELPKTLCTFPRELSSRRRFGRYVLEIATGALRRVLAFTELKFSNSMIEAWWRSLKHQWLFLHSLDSVTTVRRLVAFYVDEHTRVLPHSAFRGQTPDEMYFGTGDTVPADLRSRAAA